MKSTITCACCTEPAFVHVAWGSQGQNENLCQLHAQELHNQIVGAVATLKIPSPVYSPPRIEAQERNSQSVIDRSHDE